MHIPIAREFSANWTEEWMRAARENGRLILQVVQVSVDDDVFQMFNREHIPVSSITLLKTFLISQFVLHTSSMAGVTTRI